MAIAVIMAAVAVGGIGFATFTSSVTINGQAAAGTVNLQFDHGYATSSTPSGATCTVVFPSITPPSPTVHALASNLAPGQYCTFTLEVKNYGTLPATSEASSYTFVSGNICNSVGQTNCIWVQDQIGLDTEAGAAGSASTTISAGGTYDYTFYMTLPSGSTDQSTALSITIALTGSVGS